MLTYSTSDPFRNSIIMLTSMVLAISMVLTYMVKAIQSAMKIIFRMKLFCFFTTFSSIFVHLIFFTVGPLVKTYSVFNATILLVYVHLVSSMESLFQKYYVSVMRESSCLALGKKLQDRFCSFKGIRSVRIF